MEFIFIGNSFEMRCACFSSIFQEMQLKKGSLNYDNWIETPIPMYAKFMMFNWTNAHDIQATNYKPILTEVGPYVFLEKHTRVNITFHSENDTVSYDQIRTWHFMPDMSTGSLDDNITNANVIAVVSWIFQYIFFNIHSILAN